MYILYKMSAYGTNLLLSNTVNIIKSPVEGDMFFELQFVQNTATSTYFHTVCYCARLVGQ